MASKTQTFHAGAVVAGLTLAALAGTALAMELSWLHAPPGSHAGVLLLATALAWGWAVGEAASASTPRRA